MDKNEAHVIEDNKKESIKKIEKTIKKKDNLALKKMVIVSLICILFMMAEIIGGLLANSLAIITDAAHLFSDLSGFLISIFAIMIGQKPANKIFTFGYHRAEVLGALTSVITIWILTGFLIKEAIDRLANPTPIDAKIMLITSIFGLLCNLVMMQVLHSDLGGGHGHSGCSGHHHGHGHVHSQHEESCIHEKDSIIHVENKGIKCKENHGNNEKVINHENIKDQKHEHNCHDHFQGKSDGNDNKVDKCEGHHHHHEKNQESEFKGQETHNDNQTIKSKEPLLLLPNEGKCDDHEHEHLNEQKDKCDGNEHNKESKCKSHIIDNKHDNNHVHEHEDTCNGDGHNKENECNGHKHDVHVHKDTFNGLCHHIENKCNNHDYEHDNKHEHEHKGKCDVNQQNKENKFDGHKHDRDPEHKDDHKHHNHNHKHCCMISIPNLKEHNHKEECCDHSHLIKRKNDKLDMTHNQEHSVHNHHYDEENVNVTAAVIHIIGDIIQSVGVVIASLIIYYNPDMVIVDPICTFMFSIIVFFTTINITKTCISILMESCPDKYQVEKMEITLKKKFSDIISIHDFHIWSLSTNNVRASLHIVSFNKNLTGEVTNFMKKSYKIESITIQIESPEDNEELLNCLNKQ